MVQVRTVIPIALLAIVHKVMILDLASTEALQLFALAAAVLALGATHRLVRDQDCSIEQDGLLARNDPERDAGGDRPESALLHGEERLDLAAHTVTMAQMATTALATASTI